MRSCPIAGFLLVSQLLSSGYSQSSCPTRPINYEKELKKCLLQGYDKSIRPAPETQTIKVVISLHVRFIDLDEHYNSLKIHAWAERIWEDHNLKWNPQDYGQYQVIAILSDDIWKPDVSLITTQDASMHFGMPNTNCHVRYVGEVHCAPPTTFEGHCAADLSRWPFDEQTCNITMGSWTLTASKLNLSLAGPGVTTNMLLPNLIWELRSSSAQVDRTPAGPNDFFPTLVFTFVLRRHSAFDAATAVAPALVLATVTVLTFLLEPGCSERLMLAMTDVVAHVLYLQFMSWRLPSTGESVPALVMFFRDSLVLVGGALVLGIATRRLVRARAPPPQWLSAAASAALSCAPGQLLLLGRLSPRGAASTAGLVGEDGATLVDGGGGGGVVDGPGPLRDDAKEEAEEDNAWRLAAVALDRVALIVFSLALFALLTRYVV